LEFGPNGVLCVIEIAIEADPEHLAIHPPDRADAQASGDRIPGR
jgi:hypothetical protein